MFKYHLDVETYSAADLKNQGGFRYAEDDSTELLMVAIAKDDQEPRLWMPDAYADAVCHCPLEQEEALELLYEASHSGDKIYAHNSDFEAAICHNLWEKTFGFKGPELEQWRCTAAMCRRAAIPSSLAKAAEFLKLDMQKDTKGSALIRKFSIPQTTGKRKGQRIMPGDEPEEFRAFAGYCRQDVRTERDIEQRLEKFDLTGDTLASFQFTLRMNFRGIPVNVEGLKEADKLVNDYTGDKVVEFRDSTGLNPTQNVKVKAWFQERGYPADNLQAATVESVLANPPAEMDAATLRTLKLKSLIGFAALKKIPAMLRASCRDGNVRGGLMWCGAERTGRWAGRLVQPQNMRRPTVGGTYSAYDHICGGCTADELELLWGPPMETVASCIRHFIHDKNCQMLDADYSAIEARINPWLCGEQHVLDSFANDEKIYCKMGAVIFDTTWQEVWRLHDEKIDPLPRFVGKQAVLGCGYQMWVQKFQGTCESYGISISEELAEKAVLAWRATHPNIVKAWATIEEAAMNAVLHPGKTFHGTKKIKFYYRRAKPFPMLIMQLPSGHNLIYPLPAIEKVKRHGRSKEQLTFHGQIPHKTTWGRCSTYGGKLLENATQALAGDIMANGALKAEAAGYEIFMLVHDQALCRYQPELGHTVEGFCKALCDKPDWAEGLPLDAEGQIIEYYRK